ncbi:tRNA adenosine(34) deaminase TadA [Polynucleobacter sp. MWH-Svant-W18]|jgi:tRNA(adenine34) deaminase|uniref:tRNA adenosine(34) deaminase TadA n=1 Tax=Polynucleobacter sp. MWH-Svant-W18 TaxID=1855909 RepID=UPI001BFE4BEC|nr:tRNA adenosine(34) deaminase TadA [Polynucleobacter sp. MWH-Svant-W18]QWD78498.1 tRNA adenosine(34) deaminase TadA [Polynucleobacter sp. MWH-Svant-W18]
MSQAELDRQFMQQALEQANLAALAGEVPVGAVLVRNGQVISKGFNQPITHHDPSAHAEMLALRQAALSEKNYRLPGTTLYVTLEPCVMCAGAILHARVERIVFGATDPKTGAAGSVLDVFSSKQINHQTTAEGGVMGEECGQLLRDFFKERR